MVTLFKKLSKKETVKTVFIPFFISRFLLLFISWFCQYFQISPHYFPEGSENSYAFSPFRFLDVWGRWDSGWYLQIAQHGYSPIQQGTVGNSFAFFPIYPILIKFFSLIFPKQFLTQDVWLFIAVFLSNLFFLIALCVFYYFIKKIFAQVPYRKKIAQNSVLLLLLFPTSFFFSTAYNESLFFLLTISCFFFLFENKYFLASIIASFAALTKPYGILLLVPLLLHYFKNKNWNWQKIDLSFIYFFLPIISLFAFCIFAYLQTGDFLAFLHSQTAWHKTLSWPWKSLLYPYHFIGYITPIETIITIFALTTLGLSWKYLPHELVIWANLLNLIPLFSGTTISNMRYIISIFPFFIFLSLITQKREGFEKILLAIFLVIQVLLFTAWCQFYWVA